MIEIYLYHPLGRLTTTTMIPVDTRAQLPRLVKIGNKYYVQADRFGPQYIEATPYEIKGE